MLEPADEAVDVPASETAFDEAPPDRLQGERAEVSRERFPVEGLQGAERRAIRLHLTCRRTVGMAVVGLGMYPVPGRKLHHGDFVLLGQELFAARLPFGDDPLVALLRFGRVPCAELDPVSAELDVSAISRGLPVPSVSGDSVFRPVATSKKGTVTESRFQVSFLWPLRLSAGIRSLGLGLFFIWRAQQGSNLQPSAP